MPIVNVLSLIPEIGHELSHFGNTRPPSSPGYYSFLVDESSAWTALALPIESPGVNTERATKAILAAYDELQLDATFNFRAVFAMSTRWKPAGYRFFQSKKTYSRRLQGQEVPDTDEALRGPHHAAADYLSPAIFRYADFELSHTLWKSKPFILPTELARYVAMFYVSSLVRYRPSSLDPIKQGQQAWMMDSLAHELPTNLLMSSVAAILNTTLHFEPNQFRV